MPSFDIVSEIDSQEVLNAVENSKRELTGRFDFRGVEADFEWANDEVTVKAESDFQCQQLIDIFRNKLIKRNLDSGIMDIGKPIHSGKTFSQKVSFKQGIDSATAKKLVKLIKDSKIKVQAAVQGEQLRITGKKRDDLQQVISLIKEQDLGQPFQYTNFRD